ncbi:hypothetical protein SCHPADRAFT_893760 [Schizopora paradoxa]|uniref:Uncharacterized protein n=1 Tax=Schizopora paradoxa TaxID=27342 RepID=A0A0H2RB45_9AGAM|nr:hypothetical protein SCHPADRAFT_893760 [Schizopora paradoxa]
MALKFQYIEDLELLLQLWDHFLDCVAARIDLQVWVKNLDLCFKNIILSRKPLSYFASPIQLARIAVYLVEHATEVPFTLTTFFAPPEFNLRGGGNSIYDTSFSYLTPVGQWDLAKVSSYATSFATSVERNKFNNEYDLSSYVLNFGLDTPLQRTVFGPRTRPWVKLFAVVDDVIGMYRSSLGLVNNGTLRDSAYRNLVELVSLALRSITTGAEDLIRFKARQYFFLSQSVDIDRYYKREMLLEFRENTPYIETLNDRERFQAQLNIPNGIRHLTIIPQFRNVPYLRRYRIHGKLYIAQESAPEHLLHILSPWNRNTYNTKFAVDTMFLNEHALVYLQIHGGTMSFNCTGHYPILAGYEEGTGEALYIAFARQNPHSPWYFTTVKDGASSATYTDENGEEKTALVFFVLALRHDPADLSPSYLPHRRGAKDPTGTVYWVEFWPRTDHYYFHNITLNDDRLLMVFLEENRRRKEEECRVFDVLDGFLVI